jgi:hypothetical protein
LQALVKGHIYRNNLKIIKWYYNLYYGIKIFSVEIDGIETFYPRTKQSKRTGLALSSNQARRDLS